MVLGKGRGVETRLFVARQLGEKSRKHDDILFMDLKKLMIQSPDMPCGVS